MGKLPNRAITFAKWLLAQEVEPTETELIRRLTIIMENEYVKGWNDCISQLPDKLRLSPRK